MKSNYSNVFNKLLILVYLTRTKKSKRVLNKKSVWDSGNIQMIWKHCLRKIFKLNRSSILHLNTMILTLRFRFGGLTFLTAIYKILNQPFRNNNKMHNHFYSKHCILWKAKKTLNTKTKEQFYSCIWALFRGLLRQYQWFLKITET